MALKNGKKGMQYTMDERNKKRLKALERKKRRRKMLIMKCLFSFAVMLMILLAAHLLTRSMKDNSKEDDVLAENTDNISKQPEGDNQENPENPDDSETEAQPTPEIELPEDPDEKLMYYANLHNFEVTEYPERLVELLKENPETEEFVLNYPLKKDEISHEDLTELEDSEGVPLLLQWDMRWGYYEYGSNVLGVTGCGPTCMSMVASYLFNNPEYTPIYMAKFSTENGYVVDGGGTTWNMMSLGAEQLGLTVEEVILYEPTVLEYLEAGHPIICNVGPGYFTDGGHYIVFVGCEDGMIKINDPNSRENSEKLWEFADIEDQIKNMWVYTR